MALRNRKDAMCFHLHAEGRNKMCSVQRLKSCLSTSRKESDELFNKIQYVEVHTLRQALELIHSIAKIYRGVATKRGFNEDSPIIIALDTVSKLMPNTEATAMGYGGENKSASSAILEDSSNLEFSKMLQKWSRLIVDTLEKYNVFLVLVSHQNTKIDMNSFTARFLTNASMTEDNKTKIGGNAINQSATIQVTLTKIKEHTRKTTLGNVFLGHIIKLKVLKNSRNADKRSCFYELRVNELKDTDTTQESALDFSYGIPEMLIESKSLGLKVDSVQKDTFISKALMMDGANREEVIDYLNHNPDKLNEIIPNLGIRGKAVFKSSVDVNLEEPLQESEGSEDAVNNELEEGESFEDLAENETPHQEVEPVATEVTPKPKRGRKPKAASSDEKLDL